MPVTKLSSGLYNTYSFFCSVRNTNPCLCGLSGYFSTETTLPYVLGMLYAFQEDSGTLRILKRIAEASVPDHPHVTPRKACLSPSVGL